MRLQCTEMEQKVMCEFIDELEKMTQTINVMINGEEDECAKAGKEQMKAVFAGEEIDENKICQQFEAMTIIIRGGGKLIKRIGPIVVETINETDNEINALKSKYERK